MSDDLDFAELSEKFENWATEDRTPNLALHDACCEGDVEEAIDAIEAGADVCERDRYGKTALFYLCKYMAEEEEEWSEIQEMDVYHEVDELLNLLIKKGALNIELENSSELIFACFHTNWLYAQLLVKRGKFDLNAQDEQAKTALHHAVSSCMDDCMMSECVEYLLENGASALVFDQDGSTPLHIAASLPWDDGGRVCLELLCDHNADVDLTDNQQRTAYDYAVERYTKDDPILQRLLGNENEYTTYSVEEHWKNFTEQFGDPEAGDPVSDSIIASYKKLLPLKLISIWQKYGFCSFQDGLFQFINPDDYKEIVAQWLERYPLIAKDKYHAIAMNGFGNLFLWSEVHGQNLIITASCNILSYRNSQHYGLKQGQVDEVFSYFLGMLDREAEVEWGDDDDFSIFELAVKKLGALLRNEIFATQSSDWNVIDNYKKTTAFDYFQAQLQIKQPLLWPEDIFQLNGESKRLFAKAKMDAEGEIGRPEANN